jgi:hypothetical protein
MGKILRSAIYRRDITEQNRHHKVARKVHEAKDDAEKKAQVVEKKKAIKPTLDNMFDLRQTLTDGRAVLELPQEISGLRMQKGIDIMMAPSALANRISDMHDMDFEPEHRSLDAVSSVFVKIVHSHPSRLHLVKPHAASGQQLKDNDICVSVHSSLGPCSADDHRIVSCKTRAHGDGTFILSGLV